MIIQILKSSIRQNLTQKFLAFLTIFLASMLLASMLNITLGIGNEISKELRSYGSNILVLPKGNSLSIEVGNKTFKPLQNENYLEEARLNNIKEIFWRNNIVGFAPFVETKVLFKDKNITLIGTYFDKNVKVQDEEDFTTGVKTIYGFWKVDGNYPKDDSLDEILIGDDFARNFKISLNDSIKFNENSYKVVGILHNGGDFSNKIISSLKLAQNLTNLQGKVEKVEVSALTVPENDLALKARKNVDELNQIEYDMWYCTAYVSSIAYQIEEDFKGAAAKAQTQISDAESAVVSKIQSLMAIVSLISLVIASIAIASLMTSDIYRRKKEIGLLKALGANSTQIYLIFVLDSIFVALFSSVIGTIFGYFVSQIIAYSIFSHFIEISFVVLPITIFFSVLISIIGSLIPMKNVVELLPAEVLYGRK